MEQDGTTQNGRQQKQNKRGRGEKGGEGKEEETSEERLKEEESNIRTQGNEREPRNKVQHGQLTQLANTAQVGSKGEESKLGSKRKGYVSFCANPPPPPHPSSAAKRATLDDFRRGFLAGCCASGGGSPIFTYSACISSVWFSSIIGRE